MQRIGMLALLTLVLVFSFAAAATAATPQDIYEDYAEDGVLDGPYSIEDLEGYLDDAIVHEYGDDDTIIELDKLVTCIIGKMKTGMTYEEAYAACTGGGEERETFPFTGAQIALMFLGAAVLIGGGIALRRSAR